jgi:UDP-glucose 4-epimerase
VAVLVTGGAGYIGSAFASQLLAAGEEVAVLDDLSRGHRAAVPPGAAFYRGRTGDRGLVARIAREHRLDACVHFAAFAYVGESVAEPGRYFENNFTQAQALFEALLEAGVARVVFSSTCATYGIPREVPIPERHPQWPINPYGWSKLFVERLLESLDRAHGLKFVALRYFNAAGATARCGEHHDPETHLIPLVLAAAAGRRPKVSVFGSDYDTPDGTAVRDYIHIEDLGEAHLLALAHLRRGGASELLNLGNGTGYSVLEVIEAARRVTGRDVPYDLAPRREGDPPRLVGDASRARAVLGWSPKQPSLEAILRSAWEWAQAHPEGYASEG